MLAIVAKLRREHPDSISYPTLYLETPYACLYIYQNISTLAQAFIQSILCHTIASSDTITSANRYRSLPYPVLDMVSESSRPQLASAVRQLTDLQILLIDKDRTRYDIVFFKNLFAALNNTPFVTMEEYTAERIKQHTISLYPARKKDYIAVKLVKNYINHCEENPNSKFKKLSDYLIDIVTSQAEKSQDKQRGDDKSAGDKDDEKIARFRTIFSLISLTSSKTGSKTEPSQAAINEKRCQFMLGSDGDQLVLIVYQFLLLCIRAGQSDCYQFKELYTETKRYTVQRGSNSKWLCDELSELSTPAYATHIVGILMNLCCLEIISLYDIDISLFCYHCIFFYWFYTFGLILLNNTKPGEYSIAVSPILFNLKERYVSYKVLQGAFYNAPAEYYNRTVRLKMKLAAERTSTDDGNIDVSTGATVDDVAGDDFDYAAEDLSLLQNYTITESTGRIFVYKTADESRNEKNRNIMRILCKEPKHSFPHVDIYELDLQNFKESFASATTSLASATASFLQKTARLVIAKDKLLRGELLVPPTLINQLEFRQQDMSPADIMKLAPKVKVYQFQYMASAAIRRKFSGTGEHILEFSNSIEKCSSVSYYKAVTIAEELGCLVWKHEAACASMWPRCATLLASAYYRSPTVKLHSLQRDVQRTVKSIWEKIRMTYPTKENDNIDGLWLLIHASYQAAFEQEFDTEMMKVSSEWVTS